MTMNKLLPLIVLSCCCRWRSTPEPSPPPAIPDNAESKIRQQAAREGATAYRIIEARMGNKVHITATLDN